MTLKEVEKRLNHYLYEDLKHIIWGRFSSGDKIISLHGVIYLCKKCYQEGYDYGVQIKQKRSKKSRAVRKESSSFRSI